MLVRLLSVIGILIVGYQSDYIGVPFVWNVEQIGIEDIKFRIPTKWLVDIDRPFWIGFYDNTGDSVFQFSPEAFSIDSIQGNYYVVSASKSDLSGVVQLVFWLDVRRLAKEYVHVVPVISYTKGGGIVTGKQIGRAHV